MPDPVAGYYPRLSQIISVKDFPEIFEFAEDTLNNIFSSVRYNNFHYSKSAGGDAASYYLEIITAKRLGFELFKSGIFFLINPTNNNQVSAFPVSLQYQWGILAFLKNLDLKNFSFSPEGFYEMGLKAFRISEENAVSQAVKIFISPVEGTTIMQQVVNAVNNTYSTSFPEPTEDISPYEFISQTAAPSLNKKTSNIVFNCFIGGGIDADISKDKLESYFSTMVPGGIENYIKKLIKPWAKASLTLTAAIEFPRKLLKPVDDNLEVIASEDVKVQLQFASATFEVDTETGFNAIVEFAGTLNHPAMIGSTGLILYFEKLKLDLSKTSNIPEVDADGRPGDFIGVYAKQAFIAFPKFWNHQDNSTAVVMGRNLIIGTGGISGLLSLEATQGGGSNPAALFKLGDFSDDQHFYLSLDKFEMEFKQGSIVRTDIGGTMKIPGFKNREGDTAIINVSVHIGNNGDFRISGLVEKGISIIKFKDIFELDLVSVSVGREGNKWYLEASGSLTITATIPHFETDALNKPIEIKKIRIWQNGSIEFQLGQIPLPTFVKISYGPVSLSMNTISFGSHEKMVGTVKRKYSYFGFSGGLNVGEGAVEVRGDGIEFHYATEEDFDDSYVRIAGIAVDIKLPPDKEPEDAKVLISGWLKISSAEEGNAEGDEYYGGVDVTIRQGSLKIGGKASMKMKPKVPAWIVDLELEPGKPIPVAPELGIYGFRGLVGHHYVAEKSTIPLPEDALWYEYLKAKIPEEYQQGVYIAKFDETKEGFSVGLGATLGTISDEGFTFSCKAFLLLSIPELILIEGKGNILHERLGINDPGDPPFYGCIVISRDSIEICLGANFNLLHKGEMLNIKGELEIYFSFHSSSAWHIYLGQDQPEDKRIQARLLTFFRGYAYLMISSKFIKMGAGIKIDFDKKFGPARIKALLFLDLSAFISFKPIQLGGAIAVGGGLSLKVFGVGFEFDIVFGLSIEAPKPFIIAGYIQIKVKVLFAKFKFRLSFTWIISKQLNLVEEPVLIDPPESTSVSPEKRPYKAINMQSQEAFGLHYFRITDNVNGLTGTQHNPVGDDGWETNIVPMDSFIDIGFIRPIKPYTERFSGGISPVPQYKQDVPPKRARLPQVTHEFIVDEIKIKIWKPGAGGGWVDYDIWGALTQGFSEANLTVQNPGAYPFGYWQYDSAAGKYSKLRLLAETPFSLSNGVTPESLGLLSEKIFCAGQIPQLNCQNWLRVNKATIYEGDTVVKDRKLNLKIDEEDAVIGTIPNPFGFRYSLKVQPGNKLEIYFREPVKEVKFRITCLPGVTVALYKKEFSGSYDNEGNYTGPVSADGLQAYEYVQLNSVAYDFEDLNEEQNFSSSNDDAVDKIVITPNECSADPKAMFNNYWNSASLILQNLIDSGTLSAADKELYQSWVDEYFYKPQGELINNALEKLVPLWGRLKKNFSLNEYDHNILQQWLDNYSTYNPFTGDVPPDYEYEYEYEYEYQDEYEGAAITDFCIQWSSLLQDPNVSAWFKLYITLWKETYCVVRPSVTGLDLCNLYVHSVCWKTVKEWEISAALTLYNQNAITNSVTTLKEVINGLIPAIWRPDSYFAIAVRTADKVYVDRKEHTDSGSPHLNTYGIGFKTDKSIGYSVIETISDKLADLRYYIDYQRSYPDAAGKLLHAKPLYYNNPKLGLFFIKRYVYAFFMKWSEYQGNPEQHYKLIPVIVDPSSVSDTQVLTLEPLGWNVYSSAQVPADQADVETFSNIFNVEAAKETKCIVGLEGSITPLTTATAPTGMGMLKPEKLYTALFKATVGTMTADNGKLVHSYPFCTSKYADFKEHINSYYRAVTDVETGASATIKSLFPVTVKFLPRSLLTKINLMKQVMAKTLPVSHKLLTDFATDFDRIVYGILNFESETAVTDVEISVIKISKNMIIKNPDMLEHVKGFPSKGKLPNEGKRILGVLIKSPEPFSDPKLPAAELAKTILVKGKTGFIFIFSKDNSSIFITNSQIALPATTLDIRFRERFFDGINYVDNTANDVIIPVPLNQV